MAKAGDGTTRSVAKAGDGTTRSVAKAGDGTNRSVAKAGDEATNGWGRGHEWLGTGHTGIGYWATKFLD